MPNDHPETNTRNMSAAFVWETYPPQMYNVYAPPRRLVGQHQAMSVAYLDGDLPSITVVVNGEEFSVGIGQSIPVGGKTFGIYNHFERDARIQLLLNGPVTAERATATVQQSDFVTYQHGFLTVEEAGKDKVGLAMMLTEGRARVTFQLSHTCDAFFLPNASASFMTAKPAAALEDAFEIANSAGSAKKDLLAIKGHYNEAEVAAWAVAAEYDLSQQVELVSQRDTVTALLEPNTALFVSRNAGANLRTNVVMVDHGAPWGARVV